MNVCVFCSANDLDKKYVAPAEYLAGLLGKSGHTLLWGGSDCGLMKVIADGVQDNGGKIVGVTMELFKAFAHQGADEMIVAKTLSERKATLLKRSDAIIVLPGGLGTLDELTEVIEHKRHGAHNCPIIVLNTDGFYDGLKLQFQRMANEGFLPLAEHAHSQDEASSLVRWIQFVDTPEEVIELVFSLAG